MFETSTPGDMPNAAGIFVRYRPPSLDVIRQTCRGARRMFISDSRGIARLAFPDIQPILQMLSHLSPHLLRVRGNAKGPPFDEAALPGKLGNYTSNLAGIGRFPPAAPAYGQLQQ